MRSACWECRAVVPAHHLYEERLEYRQVGNQSRYRTITLRRLCRDCVDEQVDVRRPKFGNKAPEMADQLPLFPTP